MKKIGFHLLIILSFLALVNCNNDSLCSCGTTCSVDANGALSCSLDKAALSKRKVVFQKLFLSHAEKVEEIENGYLFVFADQGTLNEKLFEFILTEKKCCPFFQYDLKILPYNAGIHLAVTGDDKVKDFLKKLLATS